MIKVDFHVHSNLSLDSAISDQDIKYVLDNGTVDKIAITDHDEIDRALKLRDELGEKIIVGEEVKSEAGHIIGLFLSKRIEPGKSLEQTVEGIKSQGGLVYIPHIFDTWRHGIGEEATASIIDSVDIIEIFNSRARQANNDRSLQLGTEHKKLFACSTDSHSRSNLGKAYTMLEEFKNANELLLSLANAKFVKGYAPFSLMTPTFNKFKRSILK